VCVCVCVCVRACVFVTGLRVAVVCWVEVGVLLQLLVCVVAVACVWGAVCVCLHFLFVCV